MPMGSDADDAADILVFPGTPRNTTTKEGERSAVSLLPVAQSMAPLQQLPVPITCNESAGGWNALAGVRWPGSSLGTLLPLVALRSFAAGPAAGLLLGMGDTSIGFCAGLLLGLSGPGVPARSTPSSSNKGLCLG